jgi:hypothetical protein
MAALLASQAQRKAERLAKRSSSDNLSLPSAVSPVVTTPPSAVDSLASVHDQASQEFRRYVADAKAGRDIIPAYTFIDAYGVNEQTKGFVVETVTLDIGGSSAGGGSMHPFDVERPD